MMEWQELLGYVAGTLTTFAVVPQIRKAWKTRAVNDISVLTVVTLICGVSLWTVYGVVHRSWPMIITNGIAVLLNSFLLFLVFYEKRNASAEQR
jgi:MtN3 and saliva related transmembrane protein